MRVGGRPPFRPRWRHRRHRHGRGRSTAARHRRRSANHRGVRALSATSEWRSAARPAGTSPRRRATPVVASTVTVSTVTDGTACSVTVRGWSSGRRPVRIMSRHRARRSAHVHQHRPRPPGAGSPVGPACGSGLHERRGPRRARRRPRGPGFGALRGGLRRGSGLLRASCLRPGVPRRRSRPRRSGPANTAGWLRGVSAVPSASATARNICARITRSSPRTQQRAARNGSQDRTQCGILAMRPFGRLGRRLQGQVQVCSGVTVGDRIDVERVDLLRASAIPSAAGTSAGRPSRPGPVGQPWPGLLVLTTWRGG